MNNISSVGNNLPMLPAKTNAPVKQESAAKVDTNDKVELSTGKKVGKFILGAGMSLAAAPANAMLKGFQGAINAADRGLGIEGEQEGIGKNLQKLAIVAGTVVGMVSAGSLGPAGAIAGVMMGPGAIGGLIASGQGVIGGVKTGIGITGKVASKVEKKVSAKLGSLAGKAAKIATAIALGAVAIPAMAALKGIDKGIDFARKAIGISKEPKTTGEALGNLGKEGAVIYGMISGTIEASPGLVSGLAGGIATAGAIGTGVASLQEGAKGFVDGIKVSFDVADKIVRD